MSDESRLLARFGPTFREYAQIVAICVLGLAVRVVCSALWPVGFDEHWSANYGRLEPLWKLFEDLRTQEHPPLRYLVIRTFSVLGTSPLALRVHCVLAGVLSLGLVYAIGRELRLRAPLPLVGALVLAVSHTHVVMSATVRTYMVSDLFALAAFYSLLRAVRAGGGGRQWAILFALFGLMSAWCEYNGGVRLAVMVASLGLLAVPTIRDASTFRSVLRPWRVPLGVVAFGSLLLGLYFKSTIFGNDAFPGHVGRFMPSAYDSTFSFIAAGLSYLLSSFTAFRELGFGWMVFVLAVVASGFVGSLYLILRGDCDRRFGRTATVTNACLLVLCAMCMGIANIYPFGGFLRHQYYLFVPLFLALLVVIDELGRRMPRWGTHVLGVVVLTISVGTSIASFVDPFETTHPRSNKWLQAHQALVLSLEPTDGIYLTRYAVPAFSAGAPDWRWIFDRQLDKHSDLFEIRRGKERHAVLRDATWQVPVTPDVRFLTTLHRRMFEAGLHGVVVFAMRQGGWTPPSNPALYLEALRRTCGETKLSLASWLPVEGRGEVFRVTRTD